MASDNTMEPCAAQMVVACDLVVRVCPTFCEKPSDLGGQQSLYRGRRPETPPSWISSTILLPHWFRSPRDRNQLAPQYEPGIRLYAKTACLF